MGANKTDAFHRLGERSLPGADHENRLRVDCAGCLARRTCLLACAPAESFQGLHPLVYVRLRLRRGESLFRAWDSFSALYTIRSGFFKTTLLYADGREQVAGF
jgi:CRP/FNR family transcriptional regulator